MSIFVNTNVSSLNAQRQLTNSSNELNTSFERLSSGSRINRAADDAAGLQITDRMTAQVNSLNQSVRNANDGISLAQTAEGALGEVVNSLQRIRQLSVQSQNDANNADDRQAMQDEVDVLLSEITRVFTDTEFNDQNILTDGVTGYNFMVGTDDGQDITVNVGLDDPAGGGGLVDFTLANLGLSDGGGVNQIDLTDAGLRDGSLELLDDAILAVGQSRSDLGAVQNRLDSAIRNISNVSENTAGARSRIQDTDFATETANMTRNQIIQQASMSILSQANQRPQAALQLLG